MFTTLLDIYEDFILLSANILQILCQQGVINFTFR